MSLPPKITEAEITPRRLRVRVRLDVHVLFERMRAETEKLKAAGWRIVSPAQSETSPILREDPPV
jgi:hypothetical protein